MAEIDLPFKPNSHKSKEEAEKKDEKRIQKPLGKIVTKKKPLGSKFADVFLSDDVDSVRGYVLFDVLVPAIKNAISEMITGGINMMLFGETRGSSKGGYTDYGSSYHTTYKYKGGSSYSDNRRERRSGYDYKDIILESRSDAEQLRDNLIDLIEDYGSVSVADLYDALDITSEYTDHKWGWMNLKDISIRRVREGYLLVLPKPIVID